MLSYQTDGIYSIQGLDLKGIIVETESRGMSFDQLLTIPEQDEWEYSDGKSTTCVSFILAMYKQAGVFAPFTESIQVTEFTVSVTSPFICHSHNQTCYSSVLDKLCFSIN